MYSCHLFLISSASVRSIPFLSFIEPIYARNVPLVSLNFLKRSLVFPILLFSSISLHWSLRKAFLSLLAILWNSYSLLIILLFLHFPNNYAVNFSFYLYISQPCSYCLWVFQGKNTGVGCHFLLQWTIFCQNSSLSPNHFEWLWTVCLIASMSYKSPFAPTRLCPDTGKD